MGFLIFAVVSSALVSTVMKCSEGKVKSSMAMLSANYAVCLLLSRGFMGKTRVFAPQPELSTTIALGVVSGILYLASLMLMQRNVRENGMVLSSTFMKLGVLIPTLMAIVVFREQPGLVQVLGIALAVIAIVLITLERDAAGSAQKKWLLLLLLFAGGITDSMANIYDKVAGAALKDHYLFFTFLAALIFAGILCIKGGDKPRPTDFLYGICLGVPNYFSARFLLLSLRQVPAVIVYPVYSVATIVVVSAISLLLWRERLSRRKVLAMGVIFAALICINL